MSRLEEAVKKCVEIGRGEKQSEEEIEACVMNEIWRERALRKIKEANQTIGKWPEETDDKMLYRIAPDYMEKLDAISKELKEFKFK